MADKLHLVYVKKVDCAPCELAKPLAYEAARITGLPLAFQEASDIGADLLDEWKVRGVPALVLVDGDGHRVAGWTGKFINPPTIARVIARLKERTHES